jgi:hypothetical protein
MDRYRRVVDASMHGMEFSDSSSGATYAMLPLKAHQLLLLRYVPVKAA